MSQALFTLKNINSYWGDVKTVTMEDMNPSPLLAQIPEAWIDTLSAIQAELDPEAVIAGGAIRDLDNDKEIKDVDIFLSSSVSIAKVKKLLKSSFDEWTDTPEYNFTKEGTLPVRKGRHLKGSCVGTSKGGVLPVNLIVVGDDYTPTSRVVDGFDFGLCQIWYDGKDIRATMNYQIDKERSQFTLVHCEGPERFQRSLIRYQRLVQKYVDFPLVITHEYSEYAWPTSSV